MSANLLSSRGYICGVIISLILLSLGINLEAKPSKSKALELIILGVAQDAGYPQINCYAEHCLPAWQKPELRRLATSLAVVDHQHKTKYLFEATPDIKEQLYRLHQIAPDNEYRLNGIFLTHAHMGHYAGLVHLGREAAATKNIPVYAMPRMKQFLETNGPWSQLVKLKNIQLTALKDQQATQLATKLKVIPLLVPHRDEFSETVGYKIVGPKKSVLFIPDIDKWQKWSTDIRELIKQVDYAFVDATFFAAAELPNRDMSEVPHPFVSESMQLFANLSKKDKAKVRFIHFNHSNPLLIDGSDAQRQVRKQGFKFAKEGMRIFL